MTKVKVFTADDNWENLATLQFVLYKILAFGGSESAAGQATDEL